MSGSHLQLIVWKIFAHDSNPDGAPVCVCVCVHMTQNCVCVYVCVCVRARARAYLHARVVASLCLHVFRCACVCGPAFVLLTGMGPSVGAKFCRHFCVFN